MSRWRQRSISQRFGRAKLTSLAFFVSALSGCGAEAPESDGGVGASSEPLFYKSTEIWQQKLVNVCWASTGSDSDKQLVKATLKGQRSWEGAGNIVFTGFNACTSTSEPGIHVTIAPDVSLTHPRSGDVVRMDLVFADPHLDHTRCLENGLGRDECIATVALHEFGHALAIRHEHMRPDNPEAPLPPPCELSGGIGDTTYGTWDGQSIMNYCNWPIHLSGLDRKGLQLMYGQREEGRKRLSDVNGDGRADLLCLDQINGYRWVDYVDSNGQYNGTDWHAPAPSQACAAPYNRIFKGNFLGAGRTDLLCHDFVFGPYGIDLGTLPTPFADWERFPSPPNWCTHPTGRLFVGDFNGDSKDDLLCHDVSSGYMWIDYNEADAIFSNAVFDGTDWERAAGWCWGKNGSLHIGNYNGDSRQDLLCHDRTSGAMWIDYADSNGEFWGTNWQASGKCSLPSEQVVIGDFNGDFRSDFMCHNIVGGAISIDYADTNGQFSSSAGYDFIGGGPWCNHASGRLYVGRINGDTRDDLLCHDTRFGWKWVAYANSSGQFTGTGWSTGNNWCSHYSGQLF